MFATIDVTPIRDPASAVYVSDKGEGTPFPSRQSGERRTPADQSGRTSFQAYAHAAPYILQAPSEGQSAILAAAQESEGVLLDAKAIADREARIALLVKKFEGNGRVEDDARFEILTARMRRLEEPEDADLLARLSTVVSEIESASANLEAVKRKYGL